MISEFMTRWQVRAVDLIHGLATAMTAMVSAATLTMVMHGVGPTPTPTPIPPIPVPIISVPDTVTGEPGRIIQIEATTDQADVKWWCEAADGSKSVADIAYSEASSKVANFAGPKGIYKVVAYTCYWNKSLNKYVPSKPVTCVVNIGAAPPVPPGPNPPGPGPSPIPGDGLRVLVVYKGGTVLSQGQLDAMYGGDVQAYLRSKCVKGLDGKTPEFRMFPDNIDLSKESQVWKDAMGRGKADSKSTYPWVMIANGDKGVSQALPANQADMLKLLQSIGG